MKAFLAIYWRRLFVTELDSMRAMRSFWLQFASVRFPDVKNAEELIGVADKFYVWHWHGEMPTRSEVKITELRAVE